jgi:hypothetical protein
VKARLQFGRAFLLLQDFIEAPLEFVKLVLVCEGGYCRVTEHAPKPIEPLSENGAVYIHYVMRYKRARRIKA